MPVSLAGLTEIYGRHWEIMDSAGGGWIAVRRHGVAGSALARGLSNVRCAETLSELAGYLAKEAELEQRPPRFAGTSAVVVPSPRRSSSRG
ncbi:hypothetical protein GCM10009677_20040 [Sphaerisporangium rubeum]|uniref:Uncharacterized protein n=1 Tax=Sphaerisporangium rubeum TaxID=321317 RepID=A0A7X0IKB1_9ACTN|nr:hypothetical protein [Sphaerisporangium rubeum]MBB6476774.1 hypothetical protein [Sphaerisporangium rubeum]